MKTIGVKTGEDKRCRFCGTLKGQLMIHNNTESKTGLTYYTCRPCQAKYKRTWYNRKDNKEKQKEYNRRYLLKLKSQHGNKT